MTNRPTIGATLCSVLAPRVHTGQTLFADTIRRAVRTVAPDVVRRIDFGNDATFLEPLVIAQIAAGIGDPTTKTVDLSTALAIYDDPTNAGSHRARFDSATDMRVGRHGVTMLSHPVPDFEQAVFGDIDRLRGVESAARQHRATVDRALCTLENIWDELACLITETVRYVMLFDDTGQNSFASRATHGVAYLNVALGTSVAFFLEDLAHQCGHVLFSSAWDGGEDLLSVNGDTPMTNVTGKPDDHRSLEVAIHGVVTLGLMLGTLDRYIGRQPSSEETAEAQARLLFALYRLGLDLAPLAGAAVFSAEGARLFDAIGEIYNQLLACHRHTLAVTDFTGQGYNFDYDVFLLRNPLSLDCTAPEPHHA